MSEDLSHFQPSPLRVRVGNEEIEIASLQGAIQFIRSLRHDRLGRFAEMLLTQMESASTPGQQRDAWVAFRTWSGACGLQPPQGNYRRAA